MAKNQKTGKFIVIDGIDGSGKGTQTTLLVKKLKKLGVPVKTIDFPQYYNNFFGELLGEYLAGEYGDFTQVDPRVASVLYAADRFESSKQIKAWLDAGYNVIADRYVSANQIHQGGKIADPKERKEFMNWLAKMEYQIFQIPKPSLVIYLDVPFEVSKEWLKQKIAKIKKKYLKGRQDVAEENLTYLKNSRQSALMLVEENKNWRKIECCQGMTCLPVEAVHERVFAIAQEHLNK